MIRVRIDKNQEAASFPKKGVYRASDIVRWSEPVEGTGRGIPRDPLTYPEKPTKKQLDYLYALGYRGHEPKTKTQASHLIEMTKGVIEEAKRREAAMNLRMEF